MIDVSLSELTIIKKILNKQVPTCEVRVFGSRVKGSKKKYSDLDLAIVCPTKIPREKMHQIKAEFEESELPFRVDILDWQALSKSFQAAIEDQYEILPLA